MLIAFFFAHDGGAFLIFGQSRMVRDGHASVAISAEILTGIKRKTADIRKGSDLSILVESAVSLASVLDDKEVLLFAILRMGSMSQGWP